MLGWRRRQHVHGVGDARGRGEEGTQLLGRLRRERRERQAACLAGVCRENSGAARIGEDPDAPPFGQWLVREQHRHVEELLERRGPDHPGLAKQSVDDLVGFGERPRVRRGGARSRSGSAGLDGDDRLVARDAASDPGETDRIAEALQVQEDHVRARILGPVLDQVVARDVGLVADGGEGGDAEVERTREVEQREPEGSALRGERHAARRWEGRGEGRVEADLRIRVDQTHAVRADEADARGSNLVDQRSLAAASRFARLGKTGGDDDDPGDGLGHAVVHCGLDPFGGNDDDRQVDRSGDVGQARVAPGAQDLAVLRIDAHDRSPETGPEVVEDLGPDLPALPARPDDGHDGRLEQAPHGGGTGLFRALGRTFLEGRRRANVENDFLHAPFEPPLGSREAAIAEDLGHRAVLRQHVGLEAADSVAARDRGEPFEQARADPLSLQRVLDRERHRGPVGMIGEAEVLRDRDDAPRRVADQRELVVVVDAAESIDGRRIQAPQREEPEVVAVGREPFGEGRERRGVLGADGAQAQGRPRSKDDVPLFLGRIRVDRHRTSARRIGPTVRTRSTHTDHMARQRPIPRPVLRAAAPTLPTRGPTGDTLTRARLGYFSRNSGENCSQRRGRLRD